MTTARDEILARVRAALATGSAGKAGAAAPSASRATASPVRREYRESGEHAVGSAEVLDLLVDRLEDYKAQVHRVPAGEVPATIARLASELAGDKAPAERIVVPAGLEPEWVSALSDGGAAVVVDTPEAPLTPSALDQIAGVVTAARVAVAETGTIVLDAEPDQGRRAISLVPDVHICVVRAEQVVQTVPEAVRLLAHHPDRPLTWISGPSATSDIELNRVEGVHGPRRLHVILAN